MSGQVAGRSPLYPLRFEPICEYRPWGGSRLGTLFPRLSPGDGTIGEAWLLSDREDYPSRVLDGALKGQTLNRLLQQFAGEILGVAQPGRFPLLLKLLDAHDMVSVQVHPSDRQTEHLPAGETGKTEAWVVLEAGAESRVCAGLRPGTTSTDLRRALDDKVVAEHLACFTPKVGDAIFLPAGTVHAFGGGVVLFEVQQNSDVTFRLYDWDRVDASTGQPRSLQVEQAMACVDFSRGALSPVVPVVEETTPVARERLFACEYFALWRARGKVPFFVGAAGAVRVVVCIEGTGQVEHGGDSYVMEPGGVLLLPAVLGACVFRPRGVVTVLEVALP